MISSSYKRVHAKNTLTFFCGDVCSCIIITTATCGIFIAGLRERVRLKLRVGVHVCQRMYESLGNVWLIEIEFFSLLWANVCTQKDENAQMCMCDISQFRRYRINAKRKQLKCAYLWVWVGVSGWMDGNPFVFENWTWGYVRLCLGVCVSERERKSRIWWQQQKEIHFNVNLDNRSRLLLQQKGKQNCFVHDKKECSKAQHSLLLYTL